MEFDDPAAAIADLREQFVEAGLTIVVDEPFVDRTEVCCNEGTILGQLETQDRLIQAVIGRDVRDVDLYTLNWIVTD